MLPPIDGELSKLMRETDEMANSLTSKSNISFEWKEIESSKEFKILQTHFNSFVKNKDYEKTIEGKKFEEIRFAIEKFDEDLNRIKGESKDDKIGRYTLIPVIHKVYSAFDKLKQALLPQTQAEKQDEFADLFRKYCCSTKKDDINVMEQFVKDNRITLENASIDFHNAILGIINRPHISQKITNESLHILVKAGYDILYLVDAVSDTVKFVKYLVSRNISVKDIRMFEPVDFMQHLGARNISTHNFPTRVLWRRYTAADIQFLVRNGIKFDPGFVDLVTRTFISIAPPKTELLRELIFFGYISDPALKKVVVESVPATAQYFKIRDEVLEGLQLPEKILPEIVATDIFGRQTSDLGRIIARQAGIPNSLELHELCEERLTSAEDKNKSAS